MLSRLFFYGILLLFTFTFSGCFNFQMSIKKQQKHLQAKGINPRFGIYAIDSSKHRIQYTETGKQNALFLVVFVHGSPGSSSNMIDFLADSTLLESALIIAVDRPGFSGSKPRGKGVPSLQKQAAMLAPILRKHQEKKVILIGHSWGGPLIARIAMDYPTLVDGLVFVAASVDPDLEPNYWYRPILHFPLIRWSLPAWFRSSNRELMFSVQELEKMRPHWSKITQICTIIQGEKDNLVPPKNADFAVEQLINASVTLNMQKELNHFIPWRAPHLMLTAVYQQMEILK